MSNESRMEQKQGTAVGSSRRDFLGRTAAILAGASVAQTGVRAAGSAAAPAVATSGRILGANDRPNLAFIGCGMQFLGLLDRFFKRRKEEKNDFEYAAMCEVWEPRLKYAQELTGAPKLYRDYRDVLAQSDIDGVVIAVPDHWHYRMASDAMKAGKDVYLEKPLTYTIDEAAKLYDEVKATGRVLQVGGSGVLDRLNVKINEYIQSGKMGKVLWGLISYNRNTPDGMWDYPIPGIGSRHWPDAKVTVGENMDWDLWLGPAPKRPYSHERYFRWRKYWDYSGGNATDLLYHRLGAMMTMVGFDFPTRVTGAGGIYVQKNREVPDTFMTMVEYPGDFTINMISCMANGSSSPVTVYGNWGTLELTRAAAPVGDSMGDQTQGTRPRQMPRTVAQIKMERAFMKQFREANEGKDEVIIEADPSPDLGEDWLDCMRSRKQPAYDVLKGYQVMVAIKLGVDSYRQGRVMAFDPKSRQVIYPGERKEYLPAEA